MQLALTTLFLATAVLPLAAQPPVPSQIQAPRVHRVEKLSPSAFVIFGEGGNIGLFVGDQDAVLVDTQFARLVPGLLETIASITSKPIRFLINTHFHGDHVGGNPLMASRVQGILAHANTRYRMEAQQARLEASQRGGLPTLLMGEKDPTKSARLDLKLPGLELHVVHRTPAHTDSDLLVGAPADRILHMGDLMFMGRLPFIDVQEGGGSFQGLLDTLQWLASWLPEDARLIPGHGPVSGHKDLLRYHAFLKALQAHAKANPGKSSRELAESFDGAQWPEWKPTPGFVTWESLFDAVTGRGPGRVPRP